MTQHKVALSTTENGAAWYGRVWYGGARHGTEEYVGSSPQAYSIVYTVRSLSLSLSLSPYIRGIWYILHTIYYNI